MSEEDKPQIWKSPEEIEEIRNQREPTIEELKTQVRKLKRAGDALPKWLFLKQALTVAYIVLLLGILYWGLSTPMTVKTVIFATVIPLEFILVDYGKLTQRIKKLIQEA